MGFGLSGSVSVPKLEVPKVPEAPKAPDVKSAASGAIGSALGGAAKAFSLAGVAGALVEAAVSFKGAVVDFAMEPHLVLDANASFGDTKFEKGPIWIRVDLAPAQAKENAETLHLRSDDGAFDGKKKINAFTDAADKTVDILFEDAPMDQTYSLDVIDEQGAAHQMFAGIPYGDLRKTKNRF